MSSEEEKVEEEEKTMSSEEEEEEKKVEVPDGPIDPITGWVMDATTSRPIDPATRKAISRNQWKKKQYLFVEKLKKKLKKK